MRNAIARGEPALGGENDQANGAGGRAAAGTRPKERAVLVAWTLQAAQQQARGVRRGTARCAESARDPSTLGCRECTGIDDLSSSDRRSQLRHRGICACGSPASDAEESLAEFRELVWSAGGEVVGGVVAATSAA